MSKSSSAVRARLFEQGKGYQAALFGVPLVSTADFIDLLDTVVGGADIEAFTDATTVDDQFTLF